MRRVSYDNAAMRDLGILFIHLVVTVARLFGPGGAPPDEKSGNTNRKIARLNEYRWQECCRGLYQLPAAA